MKSKATQIVSDWLRSNPRKPLLVILGPTASGKTALGVKLARKFDGEIISADSRQIYTEVDKATAKPTTAEMRKAQHHLVSVFSPTKTITVAAYRKLAEKKIREILKRGKLPILTGSHTLLISALVENYQFPKLKEMKSQREELEKEYAKTGGKMKLWKRLQKLNPEAAKKISANNGFHLIRALERIEAGMQPTKGKRKYSALLLGISTEREKLYEKINQRVDKMLRSGLLKEVKALKDRYPRHSPALRGHGYRELLDYLYGEKTLEIAVEEIKRDTRNYAKRQLTWLRNSSLSKEIQWI
ncbi:MAG: tRNA (adenosine(37)-N6)-dimethylallyltransferase MiaA [Candidatus Gracilibacteria bacterium]|nr:tRNA (adenosine(37)-N6)-dimethylallyltransferase MiaA [Candidatus Gracilibacteria bacterium]MDD5179030.1 tRNA (adenosine(37)-N6)-dimethylallyltransferase MiaA [Candidatus Gracilibacteria bacterium]